MPSTILSQASGAPFPLVSGNFWSGQAAKPQGYVHLKYANNASGLAYISLSGGASITSGSFFMSGVKLDGMAMAPGETYDVPKSACGVSGSLGIFATCDAAASGQGRLFFEVY